MDVLNRAAVILAQPGIWDDPGRWDSGWWWVWKIGMLLFWIALIGLVVWWVRRRTPRRELSGVERARDILAERYARGELTSEEYRERLEQLGSAT